jgi:hypothetical protein
MGTGTGLVIRIRALLTGRPEPVPIFRFRAGVFRTGRSTQAAVYYSWIAGNADHASCNLTRAACKRDFTVPTGMPMMSAISLYGKP